MMKKIGALLVALVMVLAMSAAAFAESSTNNSTTSAAPTLATSNDTGVAGTWTKKDTEIPQAKNINIVKEIVAFNPNSSQVHAPVVTYTYTVTPATVSEQTVTDENSDHTSNTAVVAPVNAGVTTGLVVTGANASGTTVAGDAGNATSATATLVFDNTSTWNTAEAGETNTYNINLNFANVSFTQSGVYRYQIAETISAASYDAVAMKDGVYNTVYLDVYVDGNLDIYGYVCMKGNDSVTDATTKINGFVDGSEGDGTDKYYTYDLVVSKQVENDTYGEDHAFPFTITFSNPESYTSTFTITETAASGSTGISPTAASDPTWSGTGAVKEGATITYTGIPAGVDVNVYEKNDLVGVTYAVSSKVNGTEETIDNSLVYNATSTPVDVNTTAITATTAQTVEITNTLVLISPTGIVLRIAPYALMLGAGIVLIVLMKARRKEEPEEA